MKDDEAAQAAAKGERVRARLRQQLGEDCFTPFPGIDVWRGYDFPLCSPEQLRPLESPVWSGVRPTETLEEFLRGRQRGVADRAS